MADYYKSEKWLRRKYINDRMTQDEIAKLCGTTPMTISRYLKKFGLSK